MKLHFKISLAFLAVILLAGCGTPHSYRDDYRGYDRGSRMSISGLPSDSMTEAVSKMEAARSQALSSKPKTGKWTERTFANEVDIKVTVEKGEEGTIKFNGRGKGYIPNDAE